MTRTVFPGVRPSSIDFQSVRDGRRSTFFAVEVDLSSLRSIPNGNPLELNIAGNLFFADPAYDLALVAQSGIARVHFQDATLGPSNSTYITAFPGALYRVPYTRLLIENAAQPGKVLRIIYGVDVDIVASGYEGVTVQNIPVVEQPVAEKMRDDADGLAPVGSNAWGVSARMQAWSPAGVNWNRLNAYSMTTVGDAGAEAPLFLATFNYNFGYNGATWSRNRVANVFKPFASSAVVAGTGITIWTPAAGKKFRLMGWNISLSVAGQLIFGDNVVGAVFDRSETIAAAGVSKRERNGNGFLSAAANNVLKLDVTAGANVAGCVWGTEE